MSSCKITVVIPTYNYARYLERCLASVIRQESADFEVVVVDDGSSDNTRQFMMDFCSRHASHRIRYVYQDNAGPSAARNRGAAMAGGAYIWFLDADDALLPGAMALMCREIEANPGGELIFSGYRSVSEQGQGTDHFAGTVGSDRTENFRRFVFKRLGGLTTGSAIIKKEILERIAFPDGVHNNEDVVFFGHILACHVSRSVAGVVVEKIRHEGSLRNDLLRIEETGLKAVERLFDGAVLSPRQMQLRSAYLAARCLSLFRTYYLHGDFNKARGYYHRAVRAHFTALFRWSYFCKYLRCLRP